MAEEIRIARLGARGDGVGEGGAPYVPYTLPGERVRARILGDRGAASAILEPAAQRVVPQCPHFGRCGGCALQHASDAFLAQWKGDLIAAALVQRGIEGVAIRPIATSPAGARRRITVAARRTKAGVQIGFHAPGSGTIVAIGACLVADPGLIEALPKLEELVRYGASRKGAIRITLTRSEAGIDAAVAEAKPLDGPAAALLAGIAARAGLARLAWNGEVAVTRAAPVQRMGRVRVVPPPGGFLQATLEGERALVAAVGEAAGGARRIVDLFAGSGTFALPLAEAAQIRALDSDAAALAALDRGWRETADLHPIATERRDLFARPLRPGELKGVDAAVLDPPRAGARAQAECLAEARPPRIAMVSCNPATFARDSRILVDAGYRIDWIQPVDQFRWSPHVELAAQLSLAL